MPSPAMIKGSCGFEGVRTKTWKQGHSFKCSKAGRSMVRYWPPDHKGYLFTQNWTKPSFEDPDLEAELWDFCRTCKFYSQKEMEEMTKMGWA